MSAPPVPVPPHPPISLARTLLRFVLLLMVAGLVALWMSKKFNKTEPEGGLAIGKPAPEFEAVGWINGPAPKPADLKGKVVLITAWGSHCPWCELEAPELVALHKEFGDQVVFVGLTDSTAKDLQGENFVQRHHITWPNGYGVLDTLLALECDHYPMAWIVGRDGKIAWNRDSKVQYGISLEEGLKRALSAKS